MNIQNSKNDPFILSLRNIKILTNMEFFFWNFSADGLDNGQIWKKFENNHWIHITVLYFTALCSVIDVFIFLVKLNKYETDPYFLQNFQSDTTVCLIIHMVCKGYKHEIVFVLIWRTGRTILGSQLLQNTGIIKQTVVLLWKLWR